MGVLLVCSLFRFVLRVCGIPLLLVLLFFCGAFVLVKALLFVIGSCLCLSLVSCLHVCSFVFMFVVCCLRVCLLLWYVCVYVCENILFVFVFLLSFMCSCLRL